MVHVLGQMLDGVERFLPDIVTFKSQVASECEADPQVLYGAPRHHYLRLTTSELKNAEVKRTFSVLVIAVTSVLPMLIFTPTHWQ